MKLLLICLVECKLYISCNGRECTLHNCFRELPAITTFHGEPDLATVTSSSDFGDSYLPATMFDDNEDTYWQGWAWLKSNVMVWLLISRFFCKSWLFTFAKSHYFWILINFWKSCPPLRSGSASWTLVIRFPFILSRLCSLNNYAWQDVQRVDIGGVTMKWKCWPG